MKSPLLLSRNTFSQTSFAAKSLVILVFLVSFGNYLYAGIKLVNDRNKKTVVVSSKLPVMVGAPTISYGGAKTYIAGTAIAPLTPKATGIAPLSYSNTPLVLGSGLTSLRGIAVDQARNVYITDNAAGLVKKIPAAGGAAVTIGSGFVHPHALAVDALGNVYVADTNSPSIKMIPAGGGAVVSKGSGLGAPEGVALDALGNIYVADGVSGKVKMIPAVGGPIVTVGPVFNGMTTIGADATGNVYVGDDQAQSIYKIPAGGGAISTVATGFVSPTAIIVDGEGNVYIGDGNTNSVTRIPVSGSPAVVASMGQGIGEGVAVDGGGNIYFADGLNNVVRKITATGGFHINVALPSGLKFDGATGTISGTPTKAGPAKNYIVAICNSLGSASATINIKINALTISYSTPQVFTAGAAISTITPVSSGVGASGFAPEVTIAGGIAGPRGLAVDAAGNVYVADYAGGVVKEIPAGGGAPFPIGSGFTHPMGVAVDAAGNVYVVDLGSSGVTKIPPGFGVQSVIGSGLTNPYQVAIDAAGNIYVADTGNSAIKEFPANGGPAITLLTVNGLQSVAVDAAGNVYAGSINTHNIYKIPAGGGANIIYGANFSAPTAMALDTEGNLFITDGNANLVKEIPAGGGAPVIVITLGPGSMEGIAAGGDGTVYVSDYSNSNVSKNNPTGGYHISQALPAGLLFNGVTGSISGTPTTPSPATNYVVTAFNASGSGSATISIAVNALTISYAGPQIYTTATAIAPLGPVVSGVAPIAYSNTTTNIGFGFNAPHGVAIDPAGNIYIADYGNNLVKKIPAGGGPVVSLGTGLSGPTAVSFDSLGNIYVADYNSGTIKEIFANGGATSVIASGFNHPTGVVFTGGDLYVADNGNNKIKKVDHATGTTIDLGTYPNPLSIALDAAGNVYFGEGGNGVIYKIPVGGGQPFIIVSGLTAPHSIAVDAAGNLFVADGNLSNLKEIPVNTNSIVPLSKTFSLPSGVAIDPTGNLYVVDTFNSTVNKIKPVGGYSINALPAGLMFDNATGIISGTPTKALPATDYIVTGYNSFGSNSTPVNIKVFDLTAPVVHYQVPVPYIVNIPITPVVPQSTGVAALGYSTIPAIQYSNLKNPIGVAVDIKGATYVADAGNNAVKRTFANNVATIGTGFNHPTGVAVDAVGNVFVADQGNNAVKVILKVTAATNIIGSGFSSPTGVAVDTYGNVYVADKGNDAVKKIPFGGGAPVIIGSGFSQPTDVDIDSLGNVYVADAGNNAVKMIPAGGGATVLLGTGFSNPNSIHVDASGNVYVADTGNNTIEMIPAGGGLPIIISTSVIRPLGIAVDGAGIVYLTDDTYSIVKVIKPVGGYYISPTLPKGLSFNNTTGSISGTPLAGSPVTGYYLTAYNYTSGVTNTVPMQVNLFPPPTVSYNIPPPFTKNIAIAPLVPVSTNVGSVSYDSNALSIGAGFNLPSGVAVDNAGNVYVADKGSGTVDKIQKNGGGTISIGSGITDPTGVAVDGAGNVFVADGAGMVFKIPIGGGATTSIGSGFSSPSAVVVDSLGNVFVADNGNNTVKKIPAGSNTPVVIMSGLTSATGVAIDIAGNIYVADPTSGTIKKIPVGGGAPITIGSGFNQPISVAVDAGGNVYVGDFNNNAVKIIPADGSAPYAIGSGFSHPYGVAVDGAGNVYTADYQNNLVKKILPNGGFFVGPGLPAGLNFDNNTGIISGTPIALRAATNYTVTAYNIYGNASAIVNMAVNLIPPPTISYASPQVYAGGSNIAPLGPVVNGTVTAPGFSNNPVNSSGVVGSPIAVAIDGAGNTFVADQGGKILKVPANGGPSIAVGSGFNVVQGVAVDAAGNIYLTEISSSGLTKIPAGGGSPVFTNYGFTNPYGLAIDAKGNIYVAETSAGSVYEIPFNTGIPVILTSGLGSATAIAVDAAGNVYVACTGLNAIKKIPANGGAATTIATGFNSPYGVAVDNFNNVYVADFDNVIKEIPAAGGGTVIIGTGFNNPTGLAFDVGGNIFVADHGSGLIKKVKRVGGYYVSPALPVGLIIDELTGVVSGVPAKITPSANYQITAYNGSGGGAATVNITVLSPPQPPSISYPTPNVYTTGMQVTLTPVNTGGPVPATVYGQITTQAGSGVSSSTNGTGAAASFAKPIAIGTDAAGNSYVADYTGNQIRKITPAGVVTTLAGSGVAGAANGTGAAATFSNPAGIAVDGAGNVYVGDGTNNLIRKITPGGVVTTFAGSTAGAVNGTGVAAKFHTPRGLTFDASGNLYVADYSNNLIRKITPAGVVTTFAGSGVAGAVNGTGTAASFNGPFSIDIDASGNLYVADSGNNLIRIITPAGVVGTCAGSGAAGALNGTGIGASFSTPFGVAVDAGGNVYVADGANNLIRKITPAGLVSTYAGSGVAGSVNGTSTAARFSSPHGIAIDKAGNMYVADYGTNLIRKAITTGYIINAALPAGLSFDATTGVISGTPTAAIAATNYTITAYNADGNSTTTINIKVTPPQVPQPPVISYNTPNIYAAGSPVSLAPVNTGGPVPATIYGQVTTFAGNGAIGSANGTGVAASFAKPIAIATDANGNSYVADYTGNQIRKITLAGVVTTLAGSGAAGATNGTGAAATFSNPAGVAVDGSGNIYIGDGTNNLVRKITPGGVVSTFAGSGAAGSINGTGTAAKFHTPRGLVFDASGNLYVADYSNNLIRKITAAGVVSTFAGSGVAGAVNGTGIAASFNGPFSIDIDASGNLYVADSGNNLIRKITPAAVVTTFAGSGAAGAVNGTGTAASFSGPFGVAADTGGNIYIADGTNNLIRKITPAGVVTTYAGSGSVGSVNGTGAAARFSNPHGIAIDKAGNMYVADYGGNLIRKTVITGYTISANLPAGLTFDGTTGIITGTPTSASASTNYTVAAYNADGNNSTVVNIMINVPQPLQPPVISYTTPHTYSTGSPIATLYPISTGGLVPAAIYGQISTQAGSGVSGSTNGTGAAASFAKPIAVGTDAGGNSYVADYTGNQIRKVTSAGVVTTIAGSGVAGAANGTGAAATFTNPAGIAVDGAGNVYVGDGGNNLIRKITPAGVVTTFAGSTAGAVNGTGIAAKFHTPRGLAFDASGNLYVADYSNNLIRKITPAGVVTTFAGNGAAGAVNGTGTAASFSGPFSLDIDAAGNLYVADSGNNLIRKITPAGLVSTLAGSGAASAVNGTGTAATFNTPFGVAVDAGGNVYVADGTNNLIRKITPAGIVTTFAGSGIAGSINGIGTAARLSSPHGIAIDKAGNLYVADYGTNLVRKAIATGYTINPALPAGLTFNVPTGAISGTPTVAVAATDYLITAYNSDGNDVATVNITTTTTPGFAAKVDETPLDTGAPIVKQGISPNGDGIGDVLEITNIGNYPENTFQVMNRSGMLVYTVRGYDNVSRVFSGQSNINGKPLQAGTYFYQLEYGDKGKLIRKTGYILLKY
ncbi:putative Ig domain-containing protein [Mucilaginibacter sp.]|uniref:putative Ig domain-containing protein n=1 Tax=Mucilaginibacter sp. TaxID=1882438 RepID=UPI0025E6F2AF|nr:putative Ig domain-containing protein [Mucilaginibacter sp.]